MAGGFGTLLAISALSAISSAKQSFITISICWMAGHLNSTLANGSSLMKLDELIRLLPSRALRYLKSLEPFFITK